MLNRSTSVAWAEGLLAFMDADPKIALGFLVRSAMDTKPPKVSKDVSRLYDEVAVLGHGVKNPLPFARLSRKKVVTLQDRAKRFVNRIADQSVSRRTLRDELNEWLASDAVVTSTNMNVVPMDAVVEFDGDGILGLQDVHLRSPDAIVAITLAEMVNSDGPEVTVAPCHRMECPNFALQIRKQRPRLHCMRPECNAKRSTERNPKKGTNR
jgi:hypothetical protein